MTDYNRNDQYRNPQPARDSYQDRMTATEAADSRRRRRLGDSGRGFLFAKQC
jgi:hypothetical protein